MAEGDASGLAHRVAELERDMREQQQSTATIPVHEFRLGALERAMVTLTSALDRNTGAILGAALALCVSLVGVGLVLALT